MVQLPPAKPGHNPFATTLEADTVLSTSSSLLQYLRDQSMVLIEDWESLAPQDRHELEGCSGPTSLLERLVENGLLTKYQATRIGLGKSFGLVLGNYRIMERIGAGGMGVVYKAEHLRMRQHVAIKVLTLTRDEDPQLVLRFYREMRAVAQLHHQNLVGALDAGEAASPDPDGPVLHYFVMEYVQGQDLEGYVIERGPLPIGLACDLAYQVASALAEAHRHQLVHRDIKPSNILVTPEGQAKLLDFGLARHFRQRMTEPGTVLGTIDYMAPEQARDASQVDIRADLYGLGGTLYWCLTGQLPFPSQGTIEADLIRRLSQEPPSARQFRPSIPADVDAVVQRLMALTPDDRYATPQNLMRALLPYLSVSQASPSTAGAAPRPDSFLRHGPVATSVRRVLIVDDEADIRTIVSHALADEGVVLEQASGGTDALAKLNDQAYDLVLLDVDMPGMSGIELLQLLRASPPSPHLKVILCSGRASTDQMSQLLEAGADDFLSKPFTMVQLTARVHAALRLKEAQDRSDLMNRHLLAVTAEQERSLAARDSDLLHARNALVMAMARLVEHRNVDSGNHMVRMQRYCRCLAEEAAQQKSFAARVDENFIQLLEGCAPLHDIGKVGLPDHILCKPGKFDPEERFIMQSHTVLGAETLLEVARRSGFAGAFLHTAADICRHHHERWDGAGYPDRLSGEAIPLTARIVTIADVYDALRSRRSFRPALGHAAALQMMTANSAGHFDPALAQLFEGCAAQFERIRRELGD